MVSCGSDGLVKLWALKSSDDLATMDGHEDKVRSACLKISLTLNH